MDRDTLHQMIDACRPASQDVHASSMQPLADAIARDEELGRAYQDAQRADASIGRAFRAVSPPEGLATRLLDRVEAASEQEVEGQPEQVSPRRRNRRRLMVGGSLIGLAVAASVIAAMIFVDPFTAETDFADDRARGAIIDAWVAEAAAQDGWHDSSTSPEQFPGPRHVGAKLARWKLLDHGQTVCYQFGVGRDKLALLFVTRQATAGLPSGPTVPFATAVNSLSTAWADSTHVYVLAVRVSDGSAHELFRELTRLRAA